MGTLWGWGCSFNLHPSAVHINKQTKAYIFEIRRLQGSIWNTTYHSPFMSLNFGVQGEGVLNCTHANNNPVRYFAIVVEI